MALVATARTFHLTSLAFVVWLHDANPTAHNTGLPITISSFLILTAMSKMK